MIKKLLIANRGEIACRIIKTAKQLGIKTAAIYSNIDINARFVKLSDEAFSLDGIDAFETYLDIAKIIKIAIENNVDAIHPGYGFLSENAEFARACKENNIIFVGASANSIEAMGLKDSAKKIAQSAGVPILAGFMGDELGEDLLLKEAIKIGFPILIKAIAGGGGRGIRQVNHEGEFKTALQSAKREAKSAFNDDRIMLEKLVIKPRHIEVQVFGDKFGNVVHLFERDCSVQRRRQKLIEEAPAPNLPQNVRNAMFDAAIKLAKAVNYEGAGTIEFIVDGNGAPNLDGFWFLEMNTRLQVEHPVTEAITGLDLVEWQLLVASGEKLPLSQNKIQCNGHAIEARIIAEDPNNNFMPSAGKYFALNIGDDDYRLDYGFENGDFVPSNYDSLLEKMICHSSNREDAIFKTKEFLSKKIINGLKTNIGYLGRILGLNEFLNGDVYTDIIPANENMLLAPKGENLEIIAAAIAGFELNRIYKSNNSFQNFAGFRLNNEMMQNFDIFYHNELHNIKIKRSAQIIDLNDKNGDKVSIDLNKIFVDDCGEYLLLIDILPNFEQKINGIIYEDIAHIFVDGEHFEYSLNKAISISENTYHSDEIVANLPGKIVGINAKLGDKVKKNDIIILIEAMKMEHSLCAMMDGEIIEINAQLNSQVKLGDILIRLK